MLYNTSTPSHKFYFNFRKLQNVTFPGQHIKRNWKFLFKLFVEHIVSNCKHFHYHRMSRGLPVACYNMLLHK